MVADDCELGWPLPGKPVESPDEFVAFLRGAMPPDALIHFPVT